MDIFMYVLGCWGASIAINEVSGSEKWWVKVACVVAWPMIIVGMLLVHLDRE